MLKKYEAVLVFDPDLDEEGLKGQIEKIESTVGSHGGEIETRDIWGRRSLSYPMKKRQHGIYVMLVFTGKNTLVAELRRQLRINDRALRFSIVRKDKFAPDLLRSASDESVDDEERLADEREISQPELDEDLEEGSDEASV